MIPFNVPPVTGFEKEYLLQVLENRKLCGDGAFTKKCHEYFEKSFRVPKVLLTTSGTHALEMAALLLDIKEGDEVIMPSYTFVSTANAFVLRGAKIVFVDIRPDTMNIDEKLIEQAITKRTKAIVPVHYAGVSCDMDAICSIAKAHGLQVVEDAAQGFAAFWKGKPLGTLGSLGCFSFHETKNVSCGEGGLLTINDEAFADRAEIIREKGTNRARFFRGMVDKYTWVDLGSSYLPSEFNAAFLYSQLEHADLIQGNRMATWSLYDKNLRDFARTGAIELPVIPEFCQHNAHMYYIKVQDVHVRTKLIEYMKAHDITTVFHYIPLHTAPFGIAHGRFEGKDVWTTRESERLLRLPLYYGITESDVGKVCSTLKAFFSA